jgi:hypothetical protein
MKIFYINRKLLNNGFLDEVDITEEYHKELHTPLGRKKNLKLGKLSLRPNSWHETPEKCASFIIAQMKKDFVEKTAATELARRKYERVKKILLDKYNL